MEIQAEEVLEEQEPIEEKILMQGIIDLYYETSDGKLILVDYKTDYIENRDSTQLIEKYKKQLEIYQSALESAEKKKVDHVYLYSTYLGKEILVN